MKLYLVRHGDYLADATNPAGALSNKGKSNIQNLADFLKTSSIHVSSFFHSGKLRAQQTAELLSKSIVCNDKITARTGLDPLDAVTLIADEIESIEEDVLLVGHLPFLGRLVAKLITNDENKELVIFNPGTMICLEQVENKYWVINWMINASLLKKEIQNEKANREGAA